MREEEQFVWSLEKVYMCACVCIYLFILLYMQRKSRSRKHKMLMVIISQVGKVMRNSDFSVFPNFSTVNMYATKFYQNPRYF